VPVENDVIIERLIERLIAIGQSLAGTGRALALIGLGSCGLERDRLDEYSDLDFFVIVETGAKGDYIRDLSWLEAVYPVAYRFQNTADGYKLLYADGIFCEFAVFEKDELAGIPFATGRVIWKQPQINPSIAIPGQQAPPSEQKSIEWLLGEALTNLYIGLCRYRRGEKLSAARFIQQYAVDRLLELAESLETRQASIPADPFSPERRCEQRLPEFAGRLAEFVPGYEKSPQAAAAILEYLEAAFPVNPAMASAIRRLL
jgi:hypothetical protein